MCRYARRTYKKHFVCFRCRKQFKRPPIAEVMKDLGKLRRYEALRRRWASGNDAATAEAELGVMESEHRALVSVCPQCGSSMADLGLDFKPPRVAAISAWKRLENLHTIGMAWHTCGCNGPGYIPADKAAYRAYLRTRLSEHEQALRDAQEDPALDAKARSQRVSYWSERAQRVSTALHVAERSTRKNARAR